MRRYRCEHCNHIAADDEWLTAPSPFDIRDTLTGCPECKSTESAELLCDEPGCDARAGCGWPTPDGYRNTCYKHMAKAGEGEA